ncbi:glycoside hydrolase family 3 N-terminal domain-containing protein [Shewanella sp. 10N.286.52.B9]|uniref:glycoside hydrolase family 3 protein n=1 Tax=Shewanella sp. 10N.286.52.B9 TaxID=1880837 RepID=UPI001F52FF82|nr:glycoside hydrolase family 3 N-terminal domain-containing protein [Shewanella sp. 10N.286.52.B9]
MRTVNSMNTFKRLTLPAQVLAVLVGLSACGQDEVKPVTPESSSEVTSAAETVAQASITKATAATNIDIWPTLAIPFAKDVVLETRIDKLMATMTLEQKVAQMIQPEIRDITVEDMRKYGFGSYLNGGGAYPNDDKHATPSDWIELAEKMYQASMDDSVDGIAIPTMWGTDAVHGHNNVIGATLFPHNIGLGAANNPELIKQIAAITAKEVMVTGIDWVFAPTVAVVRDDRWGRTYEGYSEDPQIVKSYSHSIVEGLQGAVGEDFLSDQHVISTVKHFLGDGGTEKGIDQGDNLATEQELFDIHAQGYVGGLTAGAQTVMASFNSWHGSKIHGDKYLLNDVLKDKMGFDGFVVGDWNGHGQVAGCTNESCAQAVNAGLDVYMVPTSAWKPLYENTIAQVKNGVIAQSRIDDAVRRILRVKIRAGLFEKPSPANRAISGKTELIGAKEHRDVARQAVRESLVLLKNNNNILPISPSAKILVAGDAADNIGKQSGGWSITWQGTDNLNEDFPGATSIYAGIEQTVKAAGGQTWLSVDGAFEAANKPDVAIVVFGEEPYAEGNGDIDNLEYQRGDKRDLALLKSLKAQGIPVVAVFISGRPMWVNAELNASDAFVAAWLPGTEGDGVAQVLLSQANGEVNENFAGKLSFSWPTRPQQTKVNVFDKDYAPLFGYGYGLHYGADINTEVPSNVVANTLSEDNFATDDKLEALPLFERAVKAPWRLMIGTETSMDTVSSSIQSNDVVTLRTFDKQVQEDARLISFNGSGLGFVGLISNFPRDLRAYSNSNAALSVMIKTAKKLEQPLLLGMACDRDCRADVDITEQLNSVAIDTWQTISVDLQCFKEQQLDFGKINTPFYLSTIGAAEVSFSDLVIVPNGAEQATISCATNEQ